MYFDFDFDRDNDFFSQSPTFQMMVKKIKEDQQISDIDKKVVDASIKLWAECTIKNNLDVNCDRVDPIYLISEQNSTEVFDVLGEIMWKAKDQRTKKEFQILREQSRIHNSLQLNIIYLNEDNIDICSDLKNEFKTWKLAHEINQEISVNESKFKNAKI